ncbi:hypothetical protein JAAN108728_14110 [Janibacter anophelis]
MIAVAAGLVGCGAHTRAWCETGEGYEGTFGPLQRCVLEVGSMNPFTDDGSAVRFYRGDAPDRYEEHPWPVDGELTEVRFEDDGVTVVGAQGSTKTFPNSVYDDAR